MEQSAKPQLAARRRRRTTVQTIVEDPRGLAEQEGSIGSRGSTALPLGPALRTQQAAELRRRLLRRLQGRLDLTLTDNRSVMITVRRDPPRHHYVVRAHQLFAEAPEEIVDALARYIVLDDRKASRALGHYIDLNEDRLPPQPEEEERPRPRARTKGKHHDLKEIYAQLNAYYFDNELDVEITWGRNAARGKARSSVRLGSYTVEEKLIRIHPGLDQGWVPPFYLRWIVFHEMLHARMPIPTINGRRRFHTAAFTDAERRFREFTEAQAWERRHLHLLLRI